MPRVLPVAALIVSVLVTTGCAVRMNVGSHQDHNLNLSRYRTFAWGPADALPTGDRRLDENPFFKDHVQGAVERELARRGFELQSSGAPDLLIHYHASITKRIDVNRVDRRIRLLPRWRLSARCRALRSRHARTRHHRRPQQHAHLARLGAKQLPRHARRSRPHGENDRRSRQADAAAPARETVGLGRGPEGERYVLVNDSTCRNPRACDRVRKLRFDDRAFVGGSRREPSALSHLQLGAPRYHGPPAIHVSTTTAFSTSESRPPSRKNWCAGGSKSPTRLTC